MPIIQTPPGSTLERTNEISTKLQNIAEEVEGIQSVSSLAGYEVLQKVADQMPVPVSST